MTIAGAIFLIAVGAILRYGTNFHVKGVDVDTVGLILMVAGAAGLVLSFLYEALWSDRARRRRGEVRVEERVEPPERELPPRY
jgi:hypothetical protein